MDYSEFLDKKTHAGAAHGFEPVWMPNALFDFQVSLVTWAIRKGRAAIFADCGLGKTAMQLTWAENVARHSDRPVLILTPLAVAAQTIREGEKFGTGPADGWNLDITARAAMGRWALKFVFTSTSGRTKTEHTTWSRASGWNPTAWHPLPGSEARAIAEAWLLANPVPVPGAGVKP